MRWANFLLGMAETVFPRKNVVGKRSITLFIAGESLKSFGRTE